MLDFKKFHEDGEYVLVTTDAWFYGTDGQSYKAVWGKCKVVSAVDLLGLAPKNSTNWYLQFGVGDGAVFVAGCQAHYAMLCLQRPLGTSVWVVL